MENNLNFLRSSTNNIELIALEIRLAYRYVYHQIFRDLSNLVAKQVQLIMKY